MLTSGFRINQKHSLTKSNIGDLFQTASKDQLDTYAWTAGAAMW